jgi:hypothetical protein
MFTVQCHMADWCNRIAVVWPLPPLSSSFTEAVTTITDWELSNTTLYTAPWWNTLLINCNWEETPNGTGNYSPLLTNHKQIVVHEQHFLQITVYFFWSRFTAYLLEMKGCVHKCALSGQLSFCIHRHFSCICVIWLALLLLYISPLPNLAWLTAGHS